MKIRKIFSKQKTIKKPLEINFKVRIQRQLNEVFHCLKLTFPLYI